MFCLLVSISMPKMIVISYRIIFSDPTNELSLGVKKHLYCRMRNIINLNRKYNKKIFLKIDFILKGDTVFFALLDMYKEICFCKSTVILSRSVCKPSLLPHCYILKIYFRNIFYLFFIKVFIGILSKPIINFIWISLIDRNYISVSSFPIVLDCVDAN